VIVLCLESCYSCITEVFTISYFSLSVFSVWEIATGRCLRTIPVGGVVRSVSWCPNQALALIAVAADRKVLLVNPGVGDHLVCSKTDALLDEPPEQDVIGKV